MKEVFYFWKSRIEWKSVFAEVVIVKRLRYIPLFQILLFWNIVIIQIIHRQAMFKLCTRWLQTCVNHTCKSFLAMFDPFIILFSSLPLHPSGRMPRIISWKDLCKLCLFGSGIFLWGPVASLAYHILLIFHF